MNKCLYNFLATKPYQVASESTFRPLFILSIWEKFTVTTIFAFISKRIKNTYLSPRCNCWPCYHPKTKYRLFLCVLTLINLIDLGRGEAGQDTAGIVGVSKMQLGWKDIREGLGNRSKVNSHSMTHHVTH